MDLQAEEELKKKLQGLKDLYLSQLQLVHTAVLEHEDVSSSTLKSLDSKVAARPKALEQVQFLKCWLFDDFEE